MAVKIKEIEKKDESELALGEPHPSSKAALTWYNRWRLNIKEYALTVESLASTAIEGNRLANVCLGTIKRLENNTPISDRYLLGLVWFLKEMQEADKELGLDEFEEKTNG